MNAAHTRVVNGFGLPLSLFCGDDSAKSEVSNSTASADASPRIGDFKSRFHVDCYLALLSTMSSSSLRPSHVPLSQWEMLEPWCALRVLIALREGRCAYVSESYLRWSFSTLNRRAINAQSLACSPMASAVSASERPADVVPAWAARGMPALLALAFRIRAARFALKPRAKAWGLNTRLREIYLGESASTASMTRPVVSDADLPYSEFLAIYAKLAVNLQQPEEPVEILVSQLLQHAVNPRNRSQQFQPLIPSSRPSDSWKNSLDEAAVAEPAQLAHQLISLLWSVREQLAAAATSHSSAYPHFVSALKRLYDHLVTSPESCESSTLMPDDSCRDFPWRELENAIEQLLATEVLDSTAEHSLSSDSIVRWLQRLPHDYKRERGLTEVFDEILAMRRVEPDWKPTPTSDEDGYTRRTSANVGLVARQSARGWIGGVMLQKLPVSGLEREIVMALMTRRLGNRVVDSMAELRDSDHFGKLLDQSLFAPVTQANRHSRRKRWMAVRDRLSEWIRTTRAIRKGDDRADLMSVLEIPEKLLHSPSALQSARKKIERVIEQLDSAAIAAEANEDAVSLTWPVSSDLESLALRAASFSVSVERLSLMARQIFVERRDWFRGLE
ncbi:MAG: hypothetical protein U1A77_09965 [Pirellulales bacterium]